jgi:streptogramin lyase
LEVADDRGFLDDKALAIGHLDPQSGALKTYPIQQNADGWGPLAQATDGSLWIITAQFDSHTGTTTSIGVKHFDPRTGAFTTFTITPTFPKFESADIPLDFPDVTYPPEVLAGPPVADSPMITPASDGGVWVLCEGHSPDGFISYPVHIAPTGAQEVYLAPDGGSVVALAPGPDNKLWVIYYDVTAIPHYVLGQLTASGGITPAGRLTNSQPNYLTIGPDHRIWMTLAWNPNTIERADLPQ